MTSDIEIEELRAARKAAEESLRAAIQLAREAGQALAEATCPYRVGEVTTAKGHALHYGKQCRITRIYFACGAGEWNVVARVFKKDGTESQIQVRWSQRDDRRGAISSGRSLSRHGRPI